MLDNYNAKNEKAASIGPPLILYIGRRISLRRGGGYCKSLLLMDLLQRRLFLKGRLKSFISFNVYFPFAAFFAETGKVRSIMR